MKKIFLISFLAILSMIIGAWTLYKPVRIFSPGLVGLSCGNDAMVWTDDAARLEEAAAMYHEALRFVSTSVGRIKRAPRIVFCGSKACAETFGLGKRSALSIGKFGIIIGPRAWKPHYVRHEMIHHLQSERLGMIRVLRLPGWFIEGMAYALSEDPRPKLAEPFERYRCQFESWFRQAGKERLWKQADEL